jgi:predicted metalloprotease with PDZ domain
MKRFLLSILVLVLLISGAIASDSKSAAKAVPAKPAPTVTIALDATEAPRKILHAKLTIPAKPGPLTLYYPKWIPGEHEPSGPIGNLTGLHFQSNGQELPWRRDLLDAWTFHVDVPAGATSVDAALDYLFPAVLEAGFSSGSSATEKMAVISWNQVLLYPAGWTSDELRFEASVRMPAGWKFASPLPVASESGAEVHFTLASLTTLVDSPVLTGQYMRMEPTGENPHHELDLAADSAAALDGPPEFFEHQRNLVAQAQKLFGAHHYPDYHFLYSLSDHVAHFGLEHHASDDSRVDERGIVDPTKRKLFAGLLPHEFVHSWNGKFRRPADLATPDYQKPMQTDLLWVYEGMTSYLGDLLSARSAIRTPEEARDNLAAIAADLQYKPGRSWRNLQDTADAVPAMEDFTQTWQSWRRGLDYYDEDVLNWLWVDTILRQQTNGAKSMDDFCHAFHGGASGTAEVETYTFDDVVITLNGVAPYDWRKFWTERLTNHGPGAPLTGLENSGWKLIFNEIPSELTKANEEDREMIDSRFSLGLDMRADGGIVDTIEGLPAAKAGIGPGMKVLAVNGRKFSKNVYRDALKAAKLGSEPIELLVENTDYFRTFKIDYHDGERFPHLERDASKADMLSEIYTAK